MGVAHASEATAPAQGSLRRKSRKGRRSFSPFCSNMSAWPAGQIAVRSREEPSKRCRKLP